VDSAIAAWGNSTEIDGTAGNFPRYTQVIGNLIHAIGHFQKQSSGWFQALSAQTPIQNNVIFNGLRAGINDGFGGGNEITENLLFHECRESGDHGPITSWDRSLTTIKVHWGSSLCMSYRVVFGHSGKFVDAVAKGCGLAVDAIQCTPQRRDER